MKKFRYKYSYYCNNCDLRERNPMDQEMKPGGWLISVTPDGETHCILCCVSTSQTTRTTRSSLDSSSTVSNTNTGVSLNEAFMTLEITTNRGIAQTKFWKHPFVHVQGIFTTVCITSFLGEIELPELRRQDDKNVRIVSMISTQRLSIS